MVQKIRDVMTPNPIVLSANSNLMDAAKVMRDKGIGDVIVEKDGSLCGIVTDRDMVVRALSQGKDPKSTELQAVCSRDVTHVKPNEDVETAVDLMREKAIRRLPVMENGRPVGIVSIGDLALEKDPQSALADISMASANM